MASFKNLEIFLEFEPIVKLVCAAEDCQFNLMNSYNNADRLMTACNLKQITVGKGGQCLNYKPLPTKPGIAKDGD